MLPMDCVVANGGPPATKPKCKTIDARLTVVAAESSLTYSGVIGPVTRVSPGDDEPPRDVGHKTLIRSGATNWGQVETSRTLVFYAPRHARGFFEALVTDNLNIGRPELIELVFRRGQRRGRPAAGQFKTKIVTYGTEVNVNAFYRHSRIKQYLKDGRALRIETVINNPDDVGCRRRLCHLDELQARARAINTTLLDTGRVGQGCVLASPAFE